MDMQCPVCGEPWDMDSLHEMGDWVSEELTWEQARARFVKQGCEAFGAGHNGNEAHPGVAVLYDLLGDDMDGAVALLEDFGL